MRPSRFSLSVALSLLTLVALMIPPVLASEKATEKAKAPANETSPALEIRTLDLRKFDDHLVKEFLRIWVMAKNGADSTEAVMLLFKGLNGNYITKVLPPTNEHKKSTFVLPSHAFAIFHTHPTANNPRPSAEDMQIADKYRVLIFTLTAHGMYVYDPHAKKTSMVMTGTDWMDPLKWTADLAEKMASGSPAFKCDSSQVSSR